jgi:hypothetical protein
MGQYSPKTQARYTVMAPFENASHVDCRHSVFTENAYHFHVHTPGLDRNLLNCAFASTGLESGDSSVISGSYFFFCQG